MKTVKFHNVLLGNLEFGLCSTYSWSLSQYQGYVVKHLVIISLNLKEMKFSRLIIKSKVKIEAKKGVEMLSQHKWSRVYLELDQYRAFYIMNRPARYSEFYPVLTQHKDKV